MLNKGLKTKTKMYGSEFINSEFCTELGTQYRNAIPVIMVTRVISHPPVLNVHDFD